MDTQRYAFAKVDICNGMQLRALFDRHQPHAIMNLAAESHVDRSIDGPDDFIQTNIVGTFTLLQEALRYWRCLESKPARRLPIFARIDGRSLRFVGGGRTVYREFRIRAELSLFRKQGVV